MLNSPSGPTTILSTSNPSAASSSPSRSGRLRGLSYLYHTHIHHSSRPPIQRSQTSPHPSEQSRSPPVAAQEREVITPGRQRSNTSTSRPTSGWVPSVGGENGISRVATAPQVTPAEPPSGNTGLGLTRTETTGDNGSVNAVDDIAQNGSDEDKKAQMPTVRLIPHHDPRSTRPSLMFPIHTRTLPTHDTIIRVGRYSERDVQAVSNENDPKSMMPIGFKSKVVSRRHCELWCTNDQWYIKDVKSSSGTFLNHVRLSSAGTESKPYPINDGDIVQLGIDFKGGEEMIFRCVKIRVECNRSWQKAVNSFNTSTHKRLRNLASASRGRDSDAASVNSSECAICLNRVSPCQALFVAPCSHVWHYKCVQKLLFSQYPSFQCPNCRAYADLEADVDDLPETESDSEMEAALRASEASAPADADETENGEARPAQLQHSTTRQTLLNLSASDGDGDDELSSAMANTSIRESPSSKSRGHSRHRASTTTEPLPISPNSSSRPHGIGIPQDETPSSTLPFALTNDPLSTPRNDEGPFVLDNGIADVLYSSTRSGRRSRGTEEGHDSVDNDFDGVRDDIV